jgi:hypothetical protein
MGQRQNDDGKRRCFASELRDSRRGYWREMGCRGGRYAWREGGRVHARHVFDIGLPLRARSREVKINRKESMACMGRLLDRHGRLSARLPWHRSWFRKMGMPATLEGLMEK